MSKLHLARESLLESLCFLDDLIDLKLQEEHRIKMKIASSGHSVERNLASGLV